MAVLKLVSSAGKKLDNKFTVELDGKELSYLMFAMDVALVKLDSIGGNKGKILEMLRGYEDREGALISRSLADDLVPMWLLSDRLSMLWNVQGLPVKQDVLDDQHGR